MARRELAIPTQRVRPAVVDDLGAVARVHVCAFPQSVLSQLGEAAVGAYYRWLLTGPHEAVFLVHERSGAVDGFVVGGRFRDAMTGFVARNKLLLVRRVLLRPQLVRSAVGRRRLSIGGRALLLWARRASLGWLQPAGRRDPQGPASPAPALYRCLALAVSPDAQGCGAGQALMAGLDAAAAAGCVRRIQLGVDPANQRAVRFYELQGFRRMSQHSDWFADRPGAMGTPGAVDAAGAAWWGLMEKVLVAS